MKAIARGGEVCSVELRPEKKTFRTPGGSASSGCKSFVCVRVSFYIWGATWVAMTI